MRALTSLGVCRTCRAGFSASVAMAARLAASLAAAGAGEPLDMDAVFQARVLPLQANLALHA